VASNNFASLKSVARMGYRIFGDVYLGRLKGRSYAYSTEGCRRYGFWVEPRASTPMRPPSAPPREPSKRVASSG
jgi:hypothetical protein